MSNEQLFNEMKRAEDIELGRPVQKLDYISENLPSFAELIEDIHKDKGYLSFNVLYEIAISRSVEWHYVREHCEVKGYEIRRE